MPIRGSGSPSAIPDAQLDRPPGQRRRIGAHDHHLVAQHLDHPRVDRQRLFDGLHEPLDRAERRLVAALDRQARIAGEIGERDRHPQAALLERVVAEIGLHVADHVLLDELREQTAVEVVHERRREREDLAREPLHLLGDLHARDARAHQRLVHVQVDQAHLGVGDLGDRLPVDAHQLQERGQGQARVEHRRAVFEDLHVFVGEPVQAAASPGPCVPYRRSIRSASSPLRRTASRSG